ncbi:hypothetical protein [Coleofasciculus sp. F4-SAH-05]
MSFVISHSSFVICHLSFVLFQPMIIAVDTSIRTFGTIVETIMQRKGT